MEALYGVVPSYWRWQRWFFRFAGGSILIAALLLVFRGSDIPSAWNTFAAKAGGISFDKVIPTPQPNGYPVPSGFDFGQTLLMLPWVFFVVVCPGWHSVVRSGRAVIPNTSTLRPMIRSTRTFLSCVSPKSLQATEKDDLGGARSCSGERSIAASGMSAR